MTSSFSFRLPTDALRVTPVLRAGRSIARKEYIVLFSFSDPETAAGPDTVPAGLNWSESRGEAFAYPPPTDVDAERGDAIVRLPTVDTVQSSRELTLTVQAWAPVASVPDPVFLDAVLETELLGRPTIITAEEF